MDREEIKKEAEEQAFEKYPIPQNWDSINLARHNCYEEGYIDSAEPREKLLQEKDDKIAKLEAQIEKMRKQKVFLLQRVDSYDNSIDKQFYTTDEELAKEWNNYYRRNYYYGQAIELEEFSDKERIKDELESD